MLHNYTSWNYIIESQEVLSMGDNDDENAGIQDFIRHTLHNTQDERVSMGKTQLQGRQDTIGSSECNGMQSRRKNKRGVYLGYKEIRCVRDTTLPARTCTKCYTIQLIG